MRKVKCSRDSYLANAIPLGAEVKMPNGKQARIICRAESKDTRKVRGYLVAVKGETKVKIFLASRDRKTFATRFWSAEDE